MNNFKKEIEEDVRQYREFLKEYASLTPEDFGLAYRLTQQSLVLADRWIDWQMKANKEQAAELNVNKSDLGNWCYAHYRQLHLAFEHCRVVWSMGERFERDLELHRRTHNT